METIGKPYTQRAPKPGDAACFRGQVGSGSSLFDARRKHFQKAAQGHLDAEFRVRGLQGFRV